MGIQEFSALFFLFTCTVKFFSKECVFSFHHENKTKKNDFEFQKDLIASIYY